MFSSPVYFRPALCCEKEHQSEADEELFHFSINEVLACCMLSGSEDVYLCVQ